jgi:hypothetical protein
VKEGSENTTPLCGDRSVFETGNVSYKFSVSDYKSESEQLREIILARKYVTMIFTVEQFVHVILLRLKVETGYHELSKLFLVQETKRNQWIRVVIPLQTYGHKYYIQTEVFRNYYQSFMVS